MIDSSFYMSLAIKEAWKYQLLTYPNPAVGAVVVGPNNGILSIEAHKKAGGPHAEVEALKVAYAKLSGDDAVLSLNISSDIHNYLLKHHNSIFKNCSIFVTLEPCSHIGKTPSCAALLSELGLKKVYIGSNDFNSIGGVSILKQNHIDVECGILKSECDVLLEPFRSFVSGRFIFFKWAQRLNGSVDGGVISSQGSREYVHKLRDICDLLIIGGESVRVDRPTLDARMVGGVAPDVLIYSKRDDFDKSIPLFSVPNRRVFTRSDFECIKDYKLIMIEGGSAIFEATKDLVDFYLAFVAPKISKHNYTFSSDINFEILNLTKENQDIILWMKKG